LKTAYFPEAGGLTVIPADKQIRALHEKHAPSREAFDLVYSHCAIVCGIAEQLLGRCGLDLDADLIRAGSLLHDIGVYRLYDAAGQLDHSRYVRHGLLGHELLAAEGFAEAICRFSSCHTGVGLTRYDIASQRLPLPARDFLAESAEEQLVMYADKFHTKTDPPAFIGAAAYAASIRRFGEEKARAFESMRERWGEPDLDADAIVVRPGPRLVNGVEALAAVIHPGAGPAAAPGAVQRVR
jgi:uncharacterized protein